MWLLDSDTLSAYGSLSHPHYENVKRHYLRVGGGANVGIPVVVVYEVLRGRILAIEDSFRRRADKVEAAFASLQSTLALLRDANIVGVSPEASQVFQGGLDFPKGCGRNDRLIASIALAGEHVLVTRNLAHFVGVRGLQVENWIDDRLP